MSSTLLVLQVTRFGTVDNAFTLTPPPPHAAQHGSVPYASPRDQVLFTLAAIEDALPGSSPSSPAPKPFASFSSNHSSSSLFYSLDRHERDSFLSTFRAEAVVGGGSFLGQSDTQIRNSVATSIMATVHTDDVRVLCAGLDKVCKDQMATWQIRWSVQGADKMVLKHHDASYPSTKQNQDYDDAKPKPMGRLFEYQGEWFEEWQDPTALVPSYPEKYDDDDDMDEDGNLIDDDWQYRWTEITGIAGAGSLLTLVVRPMSDEELYDEAEETGSTAHMVIEGARSGGSISSSVGHHGSQYEEQAHRYQKKQQRRRERMAREESLSWIHNQSSGPMRPLTDSTISGTDAAAAALAFTPSGQESRHRRRRQSISGGSSSSISSICSSSSLLMVPCSPQEHALYWRLHYHHHQRRESDFSEDGYSSSEEHIRYSYYVVDPMAHPEIPRGPHMPDAFAHQRPDSHALVRRMSSSSSSAWNDASWPASRAMSNCSSVVVRHAPPNQHQYAHQFPPQHQQHQYLLTAGNNSNNNNNNSSSGWQVTSLPSVMSLPSQTLPPWNVLTTIALEAWQTWIQTIHAGKEQFQSWCEYVVELAIDQTIDNFMMAFHVVGWITGSSALMVVRSSSSNTASSSSSSSIKRVTQGECQSEQQQQQRKQEQTSQQMLRHKGSRSSLPSFSVSRRDSLAASCPEAAMWPPRQIRSKATPEWLQRHLQMRRRRRRQLQQQAAGDATILEEMEEEVEEEEDEAQEDQDEMEKINNDISVTAAATATTTATTASTVVSTIGDSTQQRPQRPGLHRRYWSTNNAPQLHSSKPEETPSSLPSLPPTQSQPVPPSSLTPLKPNGMERAGKLLDEVPVVGRMTRYVGGSWVGKKIKGRLELQQDRIDGVLDQVVDWIEVAATALPIPATITALARRGTSK
ncbi:hypothetical protein DFQ27_005587 [Actinomortierella ambigua]|uniref:Uncharacterized protein n=1 Tax=Actinomortierella ambigua TaxID=1343610 RepID=A0A9P6QLQ8_9FUNG|nr:hypothetical protein DFQ27_005587 [Actinomortierella ambigua]